MSSPARPKRQQHKNPSRRRLDSTPVFAVILGELIDYLARYSGQLTKENQILTAKISDGMLQVTSGHLQRLELPLASIPAMAGNSHAAQANLQIGEDGSHLYWPRFGLRLGWEKLEQIKRRLMAHEAKQLALALQHNLRLAEKAVKELQNAEGGAWSGGELRKKFGLSKSEFRRRREEFGIVYWQETKRVFRYPRWQFTTTGEALPGIEMALHLFHSRDQWRVMRYFLGPRLQLGGRRPLDLLRDGELEKVLAHAREHAVENTW